MCSNIAQVFAIFLASTMFPGATSFSFVPSTLMDRLVLPKISIEITTPRPAPLPKEETVVPKFPISVESFQCPYDEWVSPHSKEMLGRMNGFATKYQLYEQVGLPKKPYLYGHSLVNDYMFPRASQDPLYVTGLFMVYFFVFDNIYDADLNASEEVKHQQQVLAPTLLKMLDGKFNSKTGAGQTSLFEQAAKEMFDHLERGETCDDSYKSWYNGLQRELKAYVQATVDGKECGADVAQMSIDEYLDFRQKDSGGWFSAYLIEYAHGLYLTEEQRKLPALQDATKYCMMTCSLMNDIYSFPKEIESEVHPFNAVYILMTSKGYSEDEAYALTLNQLEHHLELFQNAERDLWDSASGKYSTAEELALANYVQGLKEFLSGIWNWSQKSGAYHHKRSPFKELRSIPN